MNKHKHLRIVVSMLQYYPDHHSGSARLAFDEAEYMAEIGHEVWVITHEIAEHRPSYCFENNLHVLRYPSAHFKIFDPRWIHVHQRRSRDFLMRYLKYPVDIVHGHALFQYAGALELYHGHAKMCYTIHSPIRLELKAAARGMSALRRLRQYIAACLNHRIERRCLEYSDCALACSEYTHGLLGSLYGKDIQSRTKILPGWVDLAKYQIQTERQAIKSQLGWPTDKPVFFTLRRLVPRMGLDRLLSAMRIVQHLGFKFHLVIGGDGSMRHYLEDLANQLEIRQSVSFVGYVPDRTLPLMYAAADAFLLPTTELECFGLIVLESLACGRPVLSTPIGAIPEIINQVEPEWLAKNASVEAIAQLIIEFLQGKLPNHDPRNLREFITNHYSKEILLPRLISTICE